MGCPCSGTWRSAGSWAAWPGQALADEAPDLLWTEVSARLYPSRRAAGLYVAGGWNDFRLGYPDGAEEIFPTRA